jgi:hypothetical protein
VPINQGLKTAIFSKNSDSIKKLVDVWSVARDFLGVFPVIGVGLMGTFFK